jgi:DNA-binding FrmR family transcriptional regulator
MTESTTIKPAVLDRLSRIEGQIRGVRRMVEEERPCFDVLKQVAAVTGALNSVGKVILEHRLRNCIQESMEGAGDKEQLVDELIEVFHRFSK